MQTVALSTLYAANRRIIVIDDVCNFSLLVTEEGEGYDTVQCIILIMHKNVSSDKVERSYEADYSSFIIKSANYAKRCLTRTLI